MNVIVGGLLACLVVFALLRATRPVPLFVLKIREGQIHVRKGSPPPGFVLDCKELVAFAGIERGTVKAFREKGTVRLAFSSGIPASHHQRFRNIWQARG